jgi:hypothetical protein
LIFLWKILAHFKCLVLFSNLVENTTQRNHTQTRWAQYPNRTQMKENKDRVIIASDVNERDGIGVEIYRNDELITEIFRDDTERTRTIRVFKENISLELMEECISTFKKEIPWDFIDYSETENEKN